MAVIRFLFALLLGFLIGVGTMIYLVQSDAGNLVIRRSEAVQDLERRLREAELARDQLGRNLEDVATRAARMEQAFNELERKFRDLDSGREKPPAANEPGT
jgi:prefoldin subunit 5